MTTISKPLYHMKLKHFLLPAMVLAILAGCTKDPATTEGGGGNTGENKNEKVELPDGKKIYIPNELKNNNFQNPDSKWSYHRMAYTDNMVIFWEKGFGSDLGNAPALNGHNMNVDLDNLKQKLESFYDYYYNDLEFVKGKSRCDSYRMMVMINYSLEGTAYGGTYDNFIGALWVAPNRIQDKNLNCIAHELGHCFQLQIIADGQGDAWGGNGFYEMTSQWMLWHVNPNWTSDELYHWEAFKTLTHKAFLHLDNIYHSPYVIEYWSMTHGLPLIAELYRKGAIGEDPVNTYKRLNSMDQERFCDEMFDACCHVVNLDYPRVWDQTRKLASDFPSWDHTEEADGWCAVTAGNCPENYGFNVIPLTVPSEGETLKVEFRGEAGKEGFVNQMTKSAGWRYGLVTLDNEGKVSYEDTHSDTEGSFEYTVGSGVSKIWLVVMGAPTSHWMLRDNAESAQWPYSVRFSGTRPA